MDGFHAIPSARGVGFSMLSLMSAAQCSAQCMNVQCVLCYVLCAECAGTYCTCVWCVLYFVLCLESSPSASASLVRVGDRRRLSGPRNDREANRND